MAREIPLTQGKVAIVDDEDFEWLSQWSWHYAQGYAASRMGKGPIIFMHRAILSTPAGLGTDHINGNGLDNRRSNLRICTQLENMRNQRKRAGCTSRFKGVSRFRDRWQAGIWIQYKRIHLGNSFRNEEEAARAYDIAARQYYGEFAVLNFPNDPAE